MLKIKQHPTHVHKYFCEVLINNLTLSKIFLPFRDPDLDREAALEADLDLEREAYLDPDRAEPECDLDPLLDPSGEFDFALPERDRLEPDLDLASELCDLDLHHFKFA